MKFDPPLTPVRLLKRYKRFLADVQLDNGEELTVHCPNTGSMKGCVVAGSPAWISDSGNTKRKYRHTWELATTESNHLAGINTGRANHLILEAINNGVITELSGYTDVKAEQRYGRENSRIDFCLYGKSQLCFVEVKSVTLAQPDGLGLFPDAISTRGSRHLRELINIHQQGQRAVLVYCVQHTGITRVAPADEIDPEYGRLLREAERAGMELLAYKADLSPTLARIKTKIEIAL